MAFQAELVGDCMYVIIATTLICFVTNGFINSITFTILYPARLIKIYEEI